MTTKKTTKVPAVRADVRSTRLLDADRAAILLRAAYDLLTKCHNASFVEEACAVTVFYDQAECDGGCLREDIAMALNIEDDTEPLASNVSGEGRA